MGAEEPSAIGAQEITAPFLQLEAPVPQPRSPHGGRSTRGSSRGRGSGAGQASGRGRGGGAGSLAGAGPISRGGGVRYEEIASDRKKLRLRPCDGAPRLAVSPLVPSRALPRPERLHGLMSK